MSIITVFARYCVSTLLFSLFINSVRSKSFYQLDTTYTGDSFFDGFDFFTGPDPTHGFVEYQDRDKAKSLGLIASGDKLAAYMGVDHINTLNPFTGPGRSSVRIESKKSFTHGLIISDIAHMPGGICGTWPAHWTLGPDWPNNGEIDIIEQVNSATKNLMSLHTSPNCTIAGANEKGGLQSNDCDTTKNYNQGCGVLSSTTTSYGAGFNQAGDGVYATEWTASYIRIWLFQGNIPADITRGHPDPSLWGSPQANFQGSCDIDSHFKSHRIIFDTTFCGDFAGTVFPTDPTCGQLAGGNCAVYVANNPTEFTNAYWSINSVKVYQLVDFVEVNSTPGIVPASQTAVAASLTSALPQSSVLAPGMGVATTSSAMPSVASQKARVGTFDFVNCAASSSNNANIVQVDDSPTMTIESCVSSCRRYLYAGVSDSKCFCANTIEQSITLVESGQCSTPCPGDPSEICGGSGVDAKRQVGVTILLSLYKNAAPSPTSSSTPLISAVPARQVLGYGMGGGADISLFVNVTVNATHLDICNTCPGGVTTITSAYTYQHCGCMDVPLPTLAPPPIPMTTVVKECELCNHGGPGTITLTTPSQTPYQTRATGAPMVTEVVVNFKGGINASAAVNATKTLRIALFTGDAGRIAPGWAVGVGVAVAAAVAVLGF